MTSEEKTIRQLKAQIERTDAQTERECAECLKYYAWVLLPTLDGTITYLDCEQLCSAGRVDMIVIAEILEVGGNTRPGAFVWELKAPQIPLFQLETQNQACPSPELYKAENQLLHYHHSVANSGHLRDRWGIVSSDHVKFGGIIIGRDNAIVNCDSNDLLLGNRLATQALRIRESIFYRASGIRIWTWDRIFKVLESQTLSHRKFVGESDTVINIKQMAERISTIAGEPE
jgi:hypothetical protein